MGYLPPTTTVCLILAFLVQFAAGQTTSSDSVTEAAPSTSSDSVTEAAPSTSSDSVTEAAPAPPSNIELFHLYCPDEVEVYCDGRCDAEHLDCLCVEHCDWVYYTHGLFERYTVIYERISGWESGIRTRERQVYCMERLRMEHHENANLTPVAYGLGCTTGDGITFPMFFDTIRYFGDYGYIEGNPVRPHLTWLAIVGLVIGIIGNLTLIIVAFAYIKPLTPTFVLIANVAIADFLFCIIAEPIQIKNYYATSQADIFTDKLPLCRFYTFIEVMSFSLSILLNLLLAIDRHIIICHPVKAQTLVSWRRIAIAIAVCWLLSMALAIPDAYHIIGDSCEHVGYRNELKIKTLLYHLIAIYFIPITITFVIYCITIHRLRNDIKAEKKKGVDSNTSDSAKTRMKMVGLLVALFVALVLLWGPRWVFGVVYYYEPIWVEYQLEAAVTREKLIELFEQFSIWSTCVNPILLFLFSTRYRGVVGRLYCCKGPKKAASDGGCMSDTIAMTGV